MAIKHKMPPSKGPEWDQVIILVPSQMGLGRRGGGKVQCEKNEKCAVYILGILYACPTIV